MYFGSQYYFDDYGHATFSKTVVTDTVKLEFLFRINKGKERISDSINSHMPEECRPIPFENMIYIGDGLTDVPSMALIKNKMVMRFRYIQKIAEVKKMYHQSFRC